MEANSNISYIASFLAGMVMFFSPCFMPLIPSYISYLTGISFSEIAETALPEDRKREVKILTLLHSLSFILGFSSVFITLGMGATLIGGIFVSYQLILKKIGAIFIILFGFLISGILNTKFFQKEVKITYKKKKITYIGSFLVGATFAFAWTPCVGPILGSILVYASSTASVKLGFKLLSIFSLGLAVPFLISSMVINSFLLFSKKINRYLRWINMAAGVVLIIFGLIILFGGRLI